MDAWRSFKGTDWRTRPDVGEFIRRNYTPYVGGPDFLCCPSEKTKTLLRRCDNLRAREQETGGVLDIDVSRQSSIIAYGPGYIDKENEVIVGLQTDRPLKRPVHCRGGIRMSRQACQAYGNELDKKVIDHFNDGVRTHNDAVFAAYSPEMKRARHLGILTGLPDSYGRGRLIGDYRRVPLYGTSALIEWKKKDMSELSLSDFEDIHLRDDITLQIDALRQLETLGDVYGFDVRRPAITAQEAFQSLYLSYLAALKDQNGAAMSIGRVSTFLDVYIERDLLEGLIAEEDGQELVDQLVLKLRMARMLRTPEYNELFAGDPLWITESIGGISSDGRTLVTKNSFRFLQTLRNLGPGPEPNMTILWSPSLPQPFKEFCTQLTMETSSIQYENDDLMKSAFGGDYGIACCVSAMEIGKAMQFFGARCNLPKLLLLAINGGKDEKTGEPIGPQMQPLNGILKYDEVWHRLMTVLDWFVPLYANTLNLIHYMHDRYCYESIQMALHDSHVKRYMAFGIAGLSIAADSFSSIKYGKVCVKRNPSGLSEEYLVSDIYPAFGNDNDDVDELAVKLIEEFNKRLRACILYRNAEPTLSILTITSNVVYGHKTGSTPDGRLSGEPFAPGANPLHGRERSGLLASLNSAAKLPYSLCKDGISYTVSLAPSSLGKDDRVKRVLLAGILDGFFSKGGHHLNVNVIDKATLIDAMNNPEKYPNLTLRVSGYAVHFVKLSKEQQDEILRRTYHLGAIA